MTLACEPEFIRALGLGLVCGFIFGAAAAGAYVLHQTGRILDLVEKNHQ
ncbi:MAG TPA: hypothetical protein VK165_08000 [Azonexus sp.]|nr:hypothetical protein [Azonexus sp.]